MVRSFSADGRQMGSLGVDDFVAVRAPRSHNDQQALTYCDNHVHSKAVGTHHFQQPSKNRFTCFGSRGSGVRIPPPNHLRWGLTAPGRATAAWFRIRQWVYCFRQRLGRVPLRRHGPGLLQQRSCDVPRLLQHVGPLDEPRPVRR